jgi:ABC-2 type transport system ATP-binding protein
VLPHSSRPGRRTVADAATATTRFDGSVDEALVLRGLHHRFGDHEALAGVDLTVHVGEVFGLLGPNGAGKRTTIRILNTLLPVQEGSAAVFGHDVRRSPMAVRRLLGYVPQQLSIEAALTGRENVAWFARLFDVPRGERGERVEEALAVMGLSDVADRIAGAYSGGMVRRLELAQALVNRPALLVLDEPTVGLDPLAREGVCERIEELREQTGMTVLLTTHYMEEADALCDRVALMHLGTIRAEGATLELRRVLGPHATLEDVFRHFTGDRLDEGTTAKGGLREVRRTRRTARRVG